MYRRRRGGNPSGFFVLVSGAIFLGVGLALALHGGGWVYLQAAIAIVGGVISLIAGTRLLSKRLPRD
jgi:membrane protein implicated in regulation of membrane protease activity